MVYYFRLIKFCTVYWSTVPEFGLWLWPWVRILSQLTTHTVDLFGSQLPNQHNLCQWIYLTYVVCYLWKNRWKWQPNWFSNIFPRIQNAKTFRIFDVVVIGFMLNPFNPFSNFKMFRSINDLQISKGGPLQRKRLWKGCASKPPIETFWLTKIQVFSDSFLLSYTVKMQKVVNQSLAASEVVTWSNPLFFGANQFSRI